MASATGWCSSCEIAFLRFLPYNLATSCKMLLGLQDVGGGLSLRIPLKYTCMMAVLQIHNTTFMDKSDTESAKA